MLYFSSLNRSAQTMISILIPTYNYNVLPLVENLHNQLATLDIPYEIKVYDDGSPTPFEENKAINDFQNCQYIQRTENIGRTAIRSLMAEQAQYDWLLFLDADVLPKTKSFVQNYTSAIRNQECDVIFGGITYDDKKPETNLVLRWKYGREREAKSVAQRQEAPFFIISQNLCIRKSIFLQANNLHENRYGLDNYFSNRLKDLNARMLHIDNPVIHFGLESNEKFIQKALEAVETTVILENRELMDKNMRPIQKSYLKLERWGLKSLFHFAISKFKGTMERNFQSDNPNLFWFDLYRLNYYIELKKNGDA